MQNFSPLIEYIALEDPYAQQFLQYVRNYAYEAKKRVEPDAPVGNKILTFAIRPFIEYLEDTVEECFEAGTLTFSNIHELASDSVYKIYTDPDALEDWKAKNLDPKIITDKMADMYVS